MHIDMHFCCCEISGEHDSMINMPFQICWLWKKVNSSEDGGFQSFLDNVQYKASGILRYERIFGDGYVSTGGVGEWLHPLLSFFLCDSISSALKFCYLSLSTRDYKRICG